MNIFLDENFPAIACLFLETQGHHVLDIRGTDREGMNDAELFALVQNQRAVFLTTDKDFFHTIPFMFPRHHGVVVVALRQPNARFIMRRLQEAWPALVQGGFANTMILLTDNKTYVRKA